MKKAKENKPVVISDDISDPSEQAIDSSDIITRIFIAGYPDCSPAICKSSNVIWPSHILQDDEYKTHADLKEGQVKVELSGAMGYEGTAQAFVRLSLKKRTHLIKVFVLLASVIFYHIFLGFAIAHNFNKASNLLLLTASVWLVVGYYKVVLPLLAQKAVHPWLTDLYTYVWSNSLVRIGSCTLLVSAITIFLIVDTARARHRLVGLGGMAFFVVVMFLFSRYPTKINWRPVIWGFFLQFCVGLMVLRWEYGSSKFNEVSEMVLTFLDFSKNGTDFVYGFLSSPPNICGMDPVFAFQSIQVVVYFGAVVALLYYYGVIQVLLRKMAWIMQVTLGTTATESLNACACIFLGMSEAPLLIRPYLERMTASELHAIMTTGFSCIAGAVFATYISFGACPRYLLSSTVMSAPGSLACSKILYPETEQSQLLDVEDLKLPEGEESNVLECISNGAVMALELVLAIVANLIVFLALLALLDSTLLYLGGLVGRDNWSFELLLGYVFFPLAYVMGVNNDTEETFRVAQLMGTKTALNEFIAYKQMGKMVKDKLLSPRSAMIGKHACMRNPQ